MKQNREHSASGFALDAFHSKMSRTRCGYFTTGKGRNEIGSHNVFSGYLAYSLVRITMHSCTTYCTVHTVTIPYNVLSLQAYILSFLLCFHCEMLRLVTQNQNRYQRKHQDSRLVTFLYTKKRTDKHLKRKCTAIPILFWNR